MKNTYRFLILAMLIPSMMKAQDWKQWMRNFISCSNCSYDIHVTLFEKPGSATILEEDKGTFARIDSLSEYYKLGQMEFVHVFPISLEIDHEDRTIQYDEVKFTGSAQNFMLGSFSDSAFADLLVMSEKKLADGNTEIAFSPKDSVFRSFKILFDPQHRPFIIEVATMPVTDWELDEQGKTVYTTEAPLMRFEYTNFKTGAVDVSRFNLDQYIKRFGAGIKGVNALQNYKVE